MDRRSSRKQRRDKRRREKEVRRAAFLKKLAASGRARLSRSRGGPLAGSVGPARSAGLRVVTAWPTIICDAIEPEDVACTKCGAAGPSYETSSEFDDDAGDFVDIETACARCLEKERCDRCGGSPAVPTEITQDAPGGEDCDRTRNVLLCANCIDSPDLVEEWAEVHEEDLGLDWSCADYQEVLRDEQGRRVRLDGQPAA